MYLDRLGNLFGWPKFMVGGLSSTCQCRKDSVWSVLAGWSGWPAAPMELTTSSWKTLGPAYHMMGPHVAILVWYASLALVRWPHNSQPRKLVMGARALLGEARAAVAGDHHLQQPRQGPHRVRGPCLMCPESRNLILWGGQILNHTLRQIGSC